MATGHLSQNSQSHIGDVYGRSVSPNTPFAASLSVLLKEQKEDEARQRRQEEDEREARKEQELRWQRDQERNEWNRLERHWEIEKMIREREMNVMRKTEKEREERAQRVQQLLHTKYNKESRQGDPVTHEPNVMSSTLALTAPRDPLDDTITTKIDSPRYPTALATTTLRQELDEQMRDKDPMELGSISRFDLNELLMWLYKRAEATPPDESELESFMTRELNRLGLPPQVGQLQVEDVRRILESCGAYQLLRRKARNPTYIPKSEGV